MTTIKRSPTIEVDLVPAPSSPLNLRLGVAYAPRNTRAHLFAGYCAMEIEPGEIAVYGYEATGGGGATVFCGSLADAYERLARCLGMTEEVRR